MPKLSTKLFVGPGITKQVKILLSANTEKKLAIAYWGKDALTRMALSPKGKNTKIICCLTNGSSDPDIIKQFAHRARQNDRLHAKVVWTKFGAMVGSANASSNGLPEEEDEAKRLIEAGVLLKEPDTLIAIENWFDDLFKRSKKITKKDLDKARSIRRQRLGHGTARSKLSLLEAYRALPVEFNKQPIWFALYKSDLTDSDKREAKKLAQKKNIPTRFGLDLKELTFYQGWELPAGAFMIDVFINKKGIASTHGPFKTFEPSLDLNDFTYALRGKRVGFPYVLTRKDRALIRARASQLWRLAGKDSTDKLGRIISLQDSAKLLQAVD